MRPPKFRERISEELQEMLEKERCYVTRTAWRALFMKDLYWASVDEKGQCAPGAAKRKFSSVFTRIVGDSEVGPALSWVRA
jgi:hypothetical protein